MPLYEPGRQRRNAGLLAHQEAFRVSRWNHRLTSKPFRQGSLWDEAGPEDVMNEDDVIHDAILANKPSMANQPSMTLEANNVLSESLQPGVSVPVIRERPAGDEAVQACVDLGTLVRQALARYMDEKNEKALGQAVAEWVAISRQPSVVSLSSESDIQDAIHAFVEHQQSNPASAPSPSAGPSTAHMTKVVELARADSLDDFVLV